MKQNYIPPIDKAIELMDGMLGYGDDYHHCTQYVAKKCALIAVGEILNILDNEGYSDGDAKFDYWKQVKQEINKL